MKLLISAALAAISPFALGQTINQISPVKATATNTITGKTTANAPKPGTPKPPTKPPTKKPTPSPSKPSGSANANQNQNANSNANANSTNSAAIGQGGKSASNSTASGGAGGLGVGSATSSAAGGQSSANGTNSVDASDRSVNNSSFRETFIPAIVPPTPPSSLAVGNVAVETSACGPLQRVIKTPVNGTFHGLFKQSKVDLGVTEELAPYLDQNGVEIQYKEVKNGDGSTSFYGHQVTTYTAVLGTAGARNLAAGGGGGSGSWGQAGLGSSSSNQQLVTVVLLRSCEAERTRPDPIAPPVSAPVEPTPVAITTPIVLPQPKARKKVASHRPVKHKKDETCAVSISVH